LLFIASVGVVIERFSGSAWRFTYSNARSVVFAVVALQLYYITCLAVVKRYRADRTPFAARPKRPEES
jgi:hypothetical protein